MLIQKQTITPVKTPTVFMVRQGDILLRQIPSIPLGARLQPPDAHGRFILSSRATTGHYHAFLRDVEIFLFGPEMFANVLADFSDLVTETIGDIQRHYSIPVPHGAYQVHSQREWFEHPHFGPSSTPVVD